MSQIVAVLLGTRLPARALLAASVVALAGCSLEPRPEEFTPPRGTSGGAPGAVPSSGSAAASGRDLQPIPEKRRSAVPVVVPGEFLVRMEPGFGGVAALRKSLPAFVVKHVYASPPGLVHVASTSALIDSAVKARLEAAPGVRYVVPNHRVRVARTPNDPRFGALWSLANSGQTGGTAGADVGALGAWDRTTGSREVLVGIIDTGIDIHHEDLVANLWRNPGEIPDNGIDDDENGFIDDIHGADVITGGAVLDDEYGHGTHVAGIIGATGDNGIGVTGVAWSAAIATCRAFDAGGGATSADVIRCYEYFHTLATRREHAARAVAINASYGGDWPDQAELDAIQALGDAGMLLVASAGNDRADNDVAGPYPASYGLDNILSVAATDEFDELAWFSNYGRRTVHVAAPGYNILSTYPGSTYALLSGTSMAAPHVTGIAALLAAEDRTRSAGAIRNLVMAGALPGTSTLPVLSGGRVRAWGPSGTGALGCEGQRLATVSAPGESSLRRLGEEVEFSALSLECARPLPLEAYIGRTFEVVKLHSSGDSAAFHGTWKPFASGSFDVRWSTGNRVMLHVPSAAYGAPVPVGFQPRAGATTDLQLSDDDVAPVDLPFSLPFAGVTEGPTRVYVSSNGTLAFVDRITEYVNEALPTERFDTVVAPFWDDLNPWYKPGSVLWGVIGSAPHRELVVEWRNIYPYGSRGGPADPGQPGMTFQVVMFEDRPEILFNYEDVAIDDPRFDNGASATVGIQTMARLAAVHSDRTASLQSRTSLLWRLGSGL